MRWDGSTVLITGASRGIGRAVSLAAARKGATLALLARSKDELDQVLAEAGGAGAVAAADIADRAQTEAAIDALVREVGVPDILVNNAGIGAYGSVLDTPVEEFERMVRVNYVGTVIATKAVLGPMIERGSGHIVNVASIAGRIGAPLEAAYSGSKFAMAGFSEALSLELANKGIGVSLINPGPVETNFFDARGAAYVRSKPKPVSAETVADAVITAVERGRREVMIPGWLKFPPIIKVLLPRAFRMGTLRDFKKDLA